MFSCATTHTVCTSKQGNTTNLSFMENEKREIRQGKFVTEVYDKSDNFNFNIVNYPLMCSNIPARHTISQFIGINSICDNLNTFVKRHRLLTERMIRQGLWYNKLCIS